MNIERAAMRGKLAELESQAERLKIRINAIRDSLRMKLNPALYAPGDLEIAEIMQQAEDLHGVAIDLLEAQADIARIERELR